ncbi:MAG TPA: AMP-binding protein, partial [Chloroflexota bacterium]|nr:AMP-binding protein [Chloroflexota bacterium]
MLTLTEVVERLSSTERGMAFVSPEGVERLSYAEIGALTSDLARRWHGVGVEPGDRVILALPNKRDFALAFLTAVRAGVVPVPVPGPERNAQVDLVMERVRSVAPDCRPKLVMTAPSLTELCSAAAMVPAVTLDGLASASPDSATVPIAPEDVAFLQYTSGSTGAPKGIAISHANILANLKAIAGVLRLSNEDVGVSWLPLHHDMGLIGFLLEPTLLQADVWHLSTAAFIERPTIWMDWMTRTRASIAYGPTFAYELVARLARPRHLEEWDLSAWRVAGCGAEPLRPVVLR